MENSCRFKDCNNLLSSRNKRGYCRGHYSIAVQGGIRKTHLSGINSRRWKGGSYITSDGYVVERMEVGEYDPSGRQRYKKRSILTMENYLERELKTGRGGNGEGVHHIDGDKMNDLISNLELISGPADHRFLHSSLEKCAYELVRRGMIVFDKRDRKYKIAGN